MSTTTFRRARRNRGRQRNTSRQDDHERTAQNGQFHQPNDSTGGRHALAP